MKLLLINPKFPESFWSFKWAIDTCLPGVKTLNPPLGLATLAALCPSDWDIEIVDEHTVELRAIHNPRGKGRVYTVWLQAEDEAGNLSQLFPVEVAVPSFRAVLRDLRAKWWSGWRNDARLQGKSNWKRGR